MPARFLDNIDDEPIFERVEEFSGGVDEYQSPTLLAQNVSQRIQNMVVDDSGKPRTRPGTDGLGGSILSANQVACLTYFDTPVYERVFAAIAASLRSWDGAAWTNLGGYPYGANTIVEMAQGNNLLYTSDGTNQWQTWSGAAWSGAMGAGATDPPVGANIMCWHTFRMFAVTGAARDTIYTSDIGSAGTGNWPVANSFRVGQGEGDDIVGLCSHKSFNLIVGKEASIYLVNANPAVAVANWQILRLSASVGVVGKRTLIAHGDQVFFLSKDGIRVITPTEGIEVPYEVSTPISQQLQPWIDRVNWSVASTSVFHRYANYVFCALPLDSDTTPKHVFVFNVRLGKWVGVWTGWNPVSMVTSRFAGVSRFLIGSADGWVNQWKDYADRTLSTTYTDNGTDITWQARSRAFQFGEPVNWKDPTWMEIRVTDAASPSATIRLYLDGSVAKTWTVNLLQIQNQLPLTLPFDLALTLPATVAKSLDGLREFNEAFIEIEGTQRVTIKNLTMGSFLNTHQNE